MSRALKIFFVFIFLAGTARAQEQVVLRADKSRVKTGETFTCAITVQGSFDSPRMDRPDFAPFKVVSRNQSQQYRMRSGRAVMKNVFSYQLVALEPGTFTIPKVIVRDGEKEYFSEEVTVEVVGEPIQPREETPELFNGAVTL